MGGCRSVAEMAEMAGKRRSDGGQGLMKSRQAACRPTLAYLRRQVWAHLEPLSERSGALEAVKSLFGLVEGVAARVAGGVVAGGVGAAALVIARLARLVAATASIGARRRGGSRAPHHDAVLDR